MKGVFKMIKKEIKCIKDVTMTDCIVFTAGNTYHAQVFNDSIQALNNNKEMHVIDANIFPDELKGFFNEHFIIK